MSDSSTALSQPTVRTPRVTYLKSLRNFGYNASNYFERGLALGAIKGIDANEEMKLRIILQGIEAVATKPETSIGRIVRVELALDRRGDLGRTRIGALLYSNKYDDPILYVHHAAFGSRQFDGIPLVDGTHLCYLLLETLGVKRAMIDEVNELVKNDSYTIVFSREPFIEDRSGDTVIAPHGGPRGTWEYWIAE